MSKETSLRETASLPKKRRLLVATLFLLVLAIPGGVYFLGTNSNPSVLEDSLARVTSAEIVLEGKDAGSQFLRAMSDSPAVEAVDSQSTETTTCSTLLDGVWVEVSCEDLLREAEQARLESGSVGSAASGGTSGNNAGPQPSPRGDDAQSNSIENPRNGSGVVDPVLETLWCPEEASENPELYTACWDGFVAPDFSLVGIHGCRAGVAAGGESDGEPAIEITVRIELIGGNYRDHTMLGEGRAWDGFNKGYTLVSKGWIVGPNDYEVRKQFTISWYAEATFFPMRETYDGKRLQARRQIGKWIYSPILTADLPGHCWPPNL